LTPTLTGLGERVHLAKPGIDLGTHIQDLLGVIHCEDLRDIVLVGHSYGGMVATGVADRARERVAHLVYLDAFVPEHGQSLFDLQSPETQARKREQARTEGDGWRVPPLPMPQDTPAEDFAWANPRRMPQPLWTFEQKLELANGPLTLPRSYLWCTQTAPHNFRRFHDRALSGPGWRCFRIEATHNPHITAPAILRGILVEIAIRA
jgi:pimeloyl-ACP methyl ester carboxylesterase